MTDTPDTPLHIKDGLNSHSVIWEDGRMVGIDHCRVVDAKVDFTISAEDNEPTICPACEKKLKLVWWVNVEVVE